MFPDFHLQTLRRKPRSPQQKFAERLALLPMAVIILYPDQLVFAGKY